MSGAVFFDCEQCGHIGLLSQLNEHPVRSCAMDIGFCPECGGEIREMLTKEQIAETLAGYGEDPETEIARIWKEAE